MTDETPRGRYYFALWPTAGEARALLRAHAEAIDALDGRRVPPERVHLTLCFVGAADETRLHAAAARVRSPGFELTFDAAQCRRRTGMLWAGVSDAPPRLQQLVNGLRAELEVERVAFDAKPLRAHVTLLRKARRRVRNATVEAVRWRCREFVLVSSQTRAEGPVYRVCGRWPLSG